MYENEINKLLNMMGIDLNVVVSNWLEETIKNIQAQNPNFSASDLALFRDMIKKNVDIESLRSLYAAIYKNHFTQEEIAGLIKFYESPLGRRSIEANLKINQESQASIETYINSLAQEVAEELIEEDS